VAADSAAEAVASTASGADRAQSRTRLSAETASNDFVEGGDEKFEWWRRRHRFNLPTRTLCGTPPRSETQPQRSGT
jgi:hypothetical protein